MNGQKEKKGKRRAEGDARQTAFDRNNLPEGW
jgi:hypothetical protein